MTSSFEQAGAQLAGVVQQQNSLVAAVTKGELWLEASAAERAAARCDQAVDEIDIWLNNSYLLTQQCKFGDNQDGNAAAERFIQVGQEFITAMVNAQQVFRNMAATYRAAGRTVAEADAANEQMFRGRSQ